MRVRFKLYRGYDEDLVSLYEMVGARTFGLLLRESLYIMIRPGYIPKTKPPDQLIRGHGQKSCISVELNLIKESDADIRELISHVRTRKVGQFLKQSLRFYLGRFACLNLLLDVPVETKKVYCMGGESFLFTGRAQGPEEERGGKRKKQKDAPAQMPEAWPPGYGQPYPAPYPYPYPYPYPFPFMYPNAAGTDVPAGEKEREQEGIKATAAPAPAKAREQEKRQGTEETKEPEEKGKQKEEVREEFRMPAGGPEPEPQRPDGMVAIAEPVGGDDDDILAMLEGMM